MLCFWSDPHKSLRPFLLFFRRVSIATMANQFVLKAILILWALSTESPGLLLCDKRTCTTKKRDRNVPGQALDHHNVCGRHP